ncbi:MAG: NHLP bacteriocin system secretion protein, partial [Cyanobacteria bacterium J06641_2]
MDNQNSKKIYRKKALAQLSSPEKLDEMMKVINPKSWLILIAFSFLIITGITWGIFGYIPITTEVKGQLVNGAIELIDSHESGILAEFKGNIKIIGECFS